MLTDMNELPGSPFEKLFDKLKTFEEVEALRLYVCAVYLKWLSFTTGSPEVKLSRSRGKFVGIAF